MTTLACLFPGCSAPSRTRGYCHRCYERLRCNGTLLVSPPARNRLCDVDGCGLPHDGLGYCSGHRQAFKEHGDPLYQPPVCSVPGCGVRAFRLGYCQPHADRFERYGDPLAAARGKTHGISGTPEFHAWYNARRRCTVEADKEYRNYGSRGISMCARWSASVEAFIADMGPRPSPQHSIDRIDNDGGYWCGSCPECMASGHPMNCRWATASEQAQNRRKAARCEPISRRSGYRGVTWDRDKRRWRASITLDGRRRHLGRFRTELCAAAAYDDAIREHFGRDDPRLNFPGTRYVSRAA